MTAIRKSFIAPATPLGPRDVRVQCSSEPPDRAGEVVVQSGISFAGSVPCLWNHDPSQPIGRAYPMLRDGALFADITFAPEGASLKADEICNLVKAGTINTVSIGFDPHSTVPMDKLNKNGPLKYLSAELLEVSFVSVPDNPDAVVIQRRYSGARPGAGKAMSSADRGLATADACVKEINGILASLPRRRPAAPAEPPRPTLKQLARAVAAAHGTDGELKARTAYFQELQRQDDHDRRQAELAVLKGRGR